MSLDITELTSQYELFERVFGNRTETLIAALTMINDRVVKPLVINLPRHFHDGRPSNDLDVVVPSTSYGESINALCSFGYHRLTNSPDPSQCILISGVGDRGIARVHLHADFQHWGLPLAMYDDMVSRCDDAGICLIPERILDYWILTTEWFFRKKSHYSGRLEQVASGLDEGELERAGAALFPRYSSLVQRVDTLRRDGYAPTDRLQVATLLAEVGPRPRLLQTLLSKAWQRRPLSGLVRRRGKLVFLMGVDGTGKTSAAEGFVRQHEIGGLSATCSYLGLKETLLQRIKASPNRSEHTGPQSHIPEGVVDRLERRSRLLAAFANLALSAVYLLDYAFRIQRIRLVLGDPDSVALVDRNYYDRLAGPRRLGDSLLYHFLPQPDLVIALTGAAEAIAQRKPEYTAGALREMQTALSLALAWLKGRQVPIAVIDTVKNDKQMVQRRINSLILGATTASSTGHQTPCCDLDQPEFAVSISVRETDTDNGDKP